ncbi:MAG: flagellar M-ring protein FliF [Candidatus Sericytochromatia bacterium]|nr:flagellar M-ring protein FliF [Candidatus Tanganyikabacteria bacterium]
MGFLANLSPQQRVVVLGGGLLAFLLIVGIVIAVAMSGGKKQTEPSAKEQQAGYVAIFRHLEPKEQDEAAAALKAKKVREFKFSEDGTLYVAKEKEPEARVALGEAQVPKKPAYPGLSIFDSKDFISTDFDKRIAFLRALNGELTRLVRKIEGVEDAAVIVNLPEDTLFQNEKKPITASVMVKLVSSKSLETKQVEGIQHMIASAVPGLMTDNVTVVDDNGNLLSSGLSANTGDQNERLAARQIDQQMKITRAMETDVQNSLQLLLDKLLGSGKSVVRVKLELDFNKRQVRNRLMAPVTANGEPLAGTERTSKETYKGGASTQGGVPGTAANVPAYPLVPDLPGAPAKPAGAETVRENKDVRYNFNQEDQIVQTASGNIKRMSIAVLLSDDRVKTDAVDKLRNVIATAAGADPARRDQVTVERVRFDTTDVDRLKAELAKKEEVKKAAKKKGGIGWGWVIWGGIGAFVLALILSLIFRRRRPAENPFEALTTSLEADALPGFDQGALAGGYGADQLYGQQPGGYGEIPGYPQSDFGAPAGYGQEQFGAPGGYEPQVAQQQSQSGGAFEFLYNVAPEQVAEYLAAERPATAAGVLAQLDSNFAETVIANMPPDVQGEVFNRLQQGAPLPAMTQRMVAQNLRRKLGAPV